MSIPVRSLCAVLLAAGSLSACELAVEVDVPEHAPQLVAHGFFAPDSVWTIRLNRSTDITGAEDARKLPITDATVSVSDANGSFSASLAHIGEGIYVAPSGAHPVPGAMYTLRAEAPGLPAVRAVSSIPAVTAGIEELGRLDDPDGFSREIYRLRVRIEDPPGTNYYKLELFRWSPVGEEDERGYRPIVDELGRPLAFMEISFGSNETSFRYKDYAYFFDSPDVSVDDNYFRGVLFSDELFDGQTKSFEITASQLPFQSVESRYRLVLSVLSDDYFTYHHTALLQSDTVGDIDIGAAILQTPPVHLHSNVEQGLGVFAGYAVHALNFDAEGNVWTGEEER